MKNKQISLLGAVGIMALSLGLGQSLNATEARSAGMGLDAHPWAVEGQLPYIFVNPAAMGQFGQMVYGETDGTATGSKGGIMLNMGAFNLGVFAGQMVNGEHSIIRNGVSSAAIPSTSLANATILAAAPNFFTAPGLTNQNAQIIGQFNLGNIALGVGVSYARVGPETTSDNTLPVPQTTGSTSRVDSSLKAIIGAAMDLNGFLLDASAALRTSDVLSTYANEDITNSTSSSAEFKNTGFGDILIDAHGAFPIGQSKLHVMAGFDILDASSSVHYSATAAGSTSTADDTYDKTGIAARAGVADEIRISDSVLAFVGLAFNFTQWTETSSWTANAAGTVTNSTLNTTDISESLILPLFFGMEANLSEKWQARFGLTANVLKIGTSSQTNYDMTNTNILLFQDNSSVSSLWNNATPTFTTGISFMHNNFSFDWNMALALFTNGPNFIGGGAPGLASDFAISYKFEGGEKKKTPITR